MSQKKQRRAQQFARSPFKESAVKIKILPISDSFKNCDFALFTC
jgi:hypothetical protein